MRVTSSSSTTLIISCILSQASAFAPKAPFLTRGGITDITSSTSKLYGMSATIDALFEKANAELGLSLTDFTQTYLGTTNVWQCDNTGTYGTAQWYGETSPKYLTGVSKTSQTNALGTQHSLNIWMGPSYDVPNMILRFGATNDGYAYVIADFMARGATPIGSDGQYLETYYGEDVQDLWQRVSNVPGATSAPPDMSFEARLLYSPARIAVGGISEAEAAFIAEEHLTRFLGWLAVAEPVPARSRGSFNMRDDKLRQFFFKGEMADNIAAFGQELGMVVAAVNTGPVAEAYVGGGS